MSITEILKDTYGKYHIEKVETIAHTLEKPIKVVRYIIYTEDSFFFVPVKKYLRLKDSNYFNYLYLHFKTYKQAEEYIKKLNKLENGTRSRN